MASVPKLHGADASGEWIAICTEPDYCYVGPKLTPFDPTRRLDAWWMANPDPRVRARTHHVYLDQDKMCGVQGDAGKGIVSGTSLGSGYVTIIAPNPTARVLIGSRPLAHDGTRARLNTNAAGAGGAEGKVQTKETGPRADEIADTALEVADDVNQSVEAANKRYAPRGTNGRYVPRSSTGRADYANPRNWQATRGNAGLVRNLGRAGKVLGPAGNVVGGISSGREQWIRDAADPTLSQNQRVARATGRGAANTTGAVAGAWAGAKAGAFVGAWFGPWGAVAGGVIGGIAGGIAGGNAGDYYADQVLASPYGK